MATITVYKDVNIDDACAPMFVAVGSSATANSNPAPTNTSWTARTLPANISWNCLCYGGGLIVALAENSSTYSTSVNGITWVGRSFPITATIEDVIYIKPNVKAETPGVFMVISSEGNVIVSMNGIDWYVDEDLPTCESFGWSGIAVDEESGILVVVADTMFDTTAQGVFANVYENIGFNVMDMPSGSWVDVCFGAGLFVAIDSGGLIATSTNGFTWTLRETPNGTDAVGMISICYGDKFVIIAESNINCFYSYDGITWYNSTMPSSALWRSIAVGVSTNRGNTDYVAISLNTTAAYSYDGIKWYSRLTTVANLAAVCYAPITWNSGDTLVISDGAVVTVDTNQSKFWKTITGNHGKLRITNSSTTEPITFAMGRSSGSTANDITPQSGLFSIEVGGTWVEIGTGTGEAYQSFVSPYNEYTAAIWVETASGTGVYETWLNISGPNERWKFFQEQGLDLVSSGIRGNYFIQEWNSSFLNRVTISGSSTMGSYNTIYTSTSGIFPGAQITGTGLQANTVVNSVIDDYTLGLNLPASSTDSSIHYIVNPVQSQMSNIIRVGNGINGNMVPLGAKVRVPNIMITDYTPVSLMTASNYLECYFNMSNGGLLSLNKCLFGQSYVSMTQAKSSYVRDVGFAYKFVLTECSSVDIDGVAIAATPPYWYYSTRWICRDMRYSNYLPLGYTVPTNNGSIWFASYINNAKIKNMNVVSHNSLYLSGSSVTASSWYVSNSDNVNVDTLRAANIDVRRTASYGVTLGPLVSNSNFKNVQAFSPYFSLNTTTMSNCNIDGYKYSLGMFNYTGAFLTNCRIVRDPATWNYLVDNKKYYVKVRTYYGWCFSDNYVDSIEYSITPFQSSDIRFPDYISIISDPTSVSGRVTFTWPRKATESGTLVYEIYRDTTEGFTNRTGSNRIFYTGTATTVTYNDDTGTVGTRYYYRFRKYHSITGKLCSAVNGSYTLTTGADFYSLYNRYGFEYSNGDTTIANYSNNIFASAFYEGCYISGAGIQAGTTIVSISPDGKDMKISLPTTASNDTTGTLYLPVQAGMAVYGTGIEAGTVVVSVESNSSLTLSNPTWSGWTNGTTYFQTFSESAEMSAIKVAAQTKIKNFCLQSRVFSTTWVASNITITANTYCPPTSVVWGTGASGALTATANNGTVTQSITGLTIGETYTASIAVRADQIFDQDYVSGSLTFGSTVSTFAATNEFKKISATFLATATSHNMVITVNLNTKVIIVSDAMVNIGSIPLPHVNTTTAAVELNPGNLPITGLYMWCKANNTCGYNHNQGVQVALGTAPTGSYYSEIHVSDVRGFTPSKSTCAGNTKYALNRFANLVTSTGNVIKDVEQVGYGMVSPSSSAPIYIGDNTSNNVFVNGNIPVEGNVFSSSLLYAAYGSNNNIIHNYNIGMTKNYIGMISTDTTNYSYGNTIQNCVSLINDTIISNQMNSSIIKNVSGGLASPNTSSSSYAIGASADSIDDGFTAVYGSMFYEANLGNSNGVMHITMMDTLSDIKPYTVISGSPYFSNTGRLYMTSTSDIIEIEWPHRIYGVSGFRDITPKMLGNDLGYLADKLDGLKIEYAIDTGNQGVYSEYKSLDRKLLVSESVSAIEGFKIKFKMQPKQHMKLSTRVSTASQGNPIRGASSGATATAVDIFINDTYGTLSVTNVTGNFLPSESIQVDRGAGFVTLANNAATNTFALGPSFASYIMALQIFTTLDTSTKYVPKYVDFTLYNVAIGSTYQITNISTSTVISTGAVTGSTTFSDFKVKLPFTFVNVDEEISVKIRKASSGTLYKPFTTSAFYNKDGGSVYVSQIADL